MNYEFTFCDIIYNLTDVIFLQQPRGPFPGAIGLNYEKQLRLWDFDNPDPEHIGASSTHLPVLPPQRVLR